jgi:hypothetical protein
MTRKTQNPSFIKVQYSGLGFHEVENNQITEIMNDIKNLYEEILSCIQKDIIKHNGEITLDIDKEFKSIKYGVDFRMGYNVLNPLSMVKVNN